MNLAACMSSSQVKMCNQLCCRRQHGLRDTIGMAIEQTEMSENPDTTLPFVSEIHMMMGSCFPRQLGLLVLMTSRVFKVCMCMCKWSAKKWPGQNPTSPTTCYSHETHHNVPQCACHPVDDLTPLLLSHPLCSCTQCTQTIISIPVCYA